jgi:hypothetical protein
VDVATGGTAGLQLDSSQNFKFNSGYGSVATAYGCRAWVNFNGTGTPAIRASGNVTSITDNGTGDYTVNFTNAMPDANYVMTGGCASSTFDDAVTYTWKVKLPSTNQLTGSCKILTVFANVGSSGGAADFTEIYVAVFR